MSAPTNRWKLGAFVVASVLVGLAAAGVLTAQTMRIVTVTYASYFDEAVTGLEVGSPVRYRGVKIGNVSAIDVAPDQRHVEPLQQVANAYVPGHGVPDPAAEKIRIIDNLARDMRQRLGAD